MNLAEEMRPKTLDEVIGNEHIVRALRKQLEEDGLSQTIMFTGQSGSGKTTFAKILASELEAAVTEIDCGSEGGIDTIRELVDSSRLSSLFANNKVYILDEIHRLSGPGQSALLKTLEEDIPNVHFFLLTTDPQKVIKTIKTRCVQYETKPATNEQIGEAVKRVEEKYNLEVENRADYWALVEQSDGSLRQAYALMEKIKASADENGFVSSDSFHAILGTSAAQVNENLPKAFLDRDITTALAAIKQAKEESGNAVGTAIGMYHYLKGVGLKVKNKMNKPLLADLAELIASKDIDWMHLEMLAWRHL